MALDKITYSCNRNSSTMHLEGIILEDEQKYHKNIKGNVL